MHYLLMFILWFSLVYLFSGLYQDASYWAGTWRTKEKYCESLWQTTVKQIIN